MNMNFTRGAGRGEERRATTRFNWSHYFPFISIWVWVELSEPLSFKFKFKSFIKQTLPYLIAAFNMEVDDHFDPVDFYTNDPPSDQMVTSSEKDANINLTLSNSISAPTATYSDKDSEGQCQKTANSLRRSGRPKPAAESLISSPPAIKFYESTVIRKKSRSSSSRMVKTSSEDSLNLNSNAAHGSKLLKLKLTGPHGIKSSKENLDEDGAAAPPKRYSILIDRFTNLFKINFYLEICGSSS